MVEMTKKQIKLKKKLERKLKTTLLDDEVVQLQLKRAAWQNTRNYRLWLFVFRVGVAAIMIGSLLQIFKVEYVGIGIGLSGCVIVLVAVINLTPHWRLFLFQIRAKINDNEVKDV